MKAGQYARMPYDVFEVLFPPGKEDDGAKEAASKFAKANGCRIENKQSDGAVWFVRD